MRGSIDLDSRPEAYGAISRGTGCSNVRLQRPSQHVDTRGDDRWDRFQLAQLDLQALDAGDAKNGSVARALTVGDYATLISPGLFLPLSALISHWGYISRDYRLALWAVAVSLAIVGLSRLLILRFRLRWASVEVLSLIATGLFLGGRVSHRVPGGTLTVVALMLVAVAVVVRLRDSTWPRLIIRWFCLMLWLWLGLALFQAVVYLGPGIELGDAAPRIEDAGGDVVIVFFDEFPNAVTASSHGVGMEAHIEKLERMGFDVEPNIKATYAFTEMAIPSFFGLDLPLSAGEALSERKRAALLGSVGGENPFVDAFRRLGYRYTLIESGWAGLRCKEAVDVCEVRPVYDEAVYWVLSGTLAAGADLRHPFTVGAHHGMMWIERHLGTLIDDDHRDLIVVHLLVPHGPFAFDAQCQPAAHRTLRADFQSQTECANKMMQQVAQITQDAAVVVLTGDHGSNLANQTALHPTDWTAEMTTERMRTFAAVRGIGSCQEPPSSSVTNIAVRLIRCLGGREVGYVEDIQLATSVRGEPLVQVSS